MSPYTEEELHEKVGEINTKIQQYNAYIERDLMKNPTLVRAVGEQTLRGMELQKIGGIDEDLNKYLNQLEQRKNTIRREMRDVKEGKRQLNTSLNRLIDAVDDLKQRKEAFRSSESRE